MMASAWPAQGDGSGDPMLIRVYNFMTLDCLTGRKLTSSFKYTAAQIEKLGCEVLPNTAIDVDESQLDDDGAYVPGADASKQRRLARASPLT
jgi:hypothetical protein